jgi:hypothetical protein
MSKQERREITATVPGNLLISGEYVILEDGGQGISVACGPEARGRSWQRTSGWVGNPRHHR